MEVGRLSACVLLAACAIGLVFGLPARSHAAVPEGFQDQLLAPIPNATGLAIVPDGRILITTQLGEVRVYEGGSLQPGHAIALGDRMCTEAERGLAGIAVDPGFADRHYVYLYYTYKGSTNCSTDPAAAEDQPVNRVSRFTLGENDLIDPNSETVLVDGIPSPIGIHNAGDLHFGRDGYLYVAVGDGGCDYSLLSGCGPSNMAPRYPHVLSGKILRITADGGVPSDNPHIGPGTASCASTGRTSAGTWCQEIYAAGLRNPFRLAFDSNAPTTRFYINDVGGANWEEINLGIPGADYGWNQREGHCATGSSTNCGPPPDGMTNPIFDYDHELGCSSITAGAFVPNGMWPAQYDNSYLFGDFVCGKVWQLMPNGAGGYITVDFASDIGGPTAFAFSQSGSPPALYYVNYMQWVTQPGLHRIVYTGSANRSPAAVATASPTSGPAPLQVNFHGEESSDPDNDPLTFQWDFGDGAAATEASPSHEYQTAGTYTATLTVSDGQAGQDTAEIRIDASNDAPIPSIASPTANQLFRVGETISLSGSATDPEDFTVPSSSLSWQVVKHHATHTHPFLAPTSGSSTTITTPIPEDFTATTNSYLEVRLTATDSQGLSTTVTRELRPRLVNLSFATNPAGLRIDLNGAVAPAAITSWDGWALQIDAPTPQYDSEGQEQAFVSWADGSAQSHTITTPSTETTYTASFTRNPLQPPPARSGPPATPLSATGASQSGQDEAFISRKTAISKAKRALARRFGRAYRRGKKKRLSCFRSDGYYRCPYSFNYRNKTRKGTVTVTQTATGIQTQIKRRT